MITVNNIKMYEKPTFCNRCGFFSRPLEEDTDGFCRLWCEDVRSYHAPMEHCQRFLDEAFQLPDGSSLKVVVKNFEFFITL